MYKEKMGKSLNLTEPKSFNEKLQWLKLHDNTPLKTICCDKYKVREYVKDKIGEEYLIKLLGVYEKFSDIDISKLPDTFILKCNHGSGFNYIIKNKNKENWGEIEKKFNTWLERDYSFPTLEMQYHKIPRRIIAEEYIGALDKNPTDYKIHCFNGSPQYIEAISGRDLVTHTALDTYYTATWQASPFQSLVLGGKENDAPRPVNLDKMLEVAKTLAKDFIYVRVDLYNVEGKIYFGELTFAPAGGENKYDPPEADYTIGEKLKLPIEK